MSFFTIFNRIYEKIIHEYMIYSLKNKKYNKENYREKIPVVVSLTTFPERFDSVKITLKSLLNQTVSPEKITLWLGSDSIGYPVYDIFKNEIEQGVEVNLDEKLNIRSHKKYFYSMQQNPDYPVILVDDDLIYPSNMIQKLWYNHLKFPDSIIARRVHKITLDSDGNIKPYIKWDGSTKDFYKKVTGYFFTSGAGTLIPSHILGNEVFDLEKINKLSPYADDVWLNFMAVINKVPIVLIKNGVPMPATVKGSQEKALAYENFGNNRNDIYINNIINHYSLKKKDIDWIK